MNNLESLRSELGLKIVQLDPNDLRLPLIGDALNSINEMVVSLEDDGASTLTEAAVTVQKLLEAMAMDTLPIEDGVGRVTALFEALDEALEMQYEFGSISEGELQEAVSMSVAGTSIPSLGTAEADLQKDESKLQNKKDKKTGSKKVKATSKKKQTKKTKQTTTTETTQSEVSTSEDIDSENEEEVIQFVSDELMDDPLLFEAMNEARENLESAEENLLRLERDVTDHSLIDGIFRPVHTIKGTAGFLEWDAINTVCHRAEDILVKLRDGKMSTSPIIVDCMLEVIDVVGKLLEQIEELIQKNQGSENDIVPVKIGPVLRRLDRIANGETEESSTEEAGVETSDVENNSDASRQVDNDDPSQRNTGAKTILGDVVKVPADKLDEFSELVGELVVAVSVLSQHEVFGSIADRSLLDRLDQMETITERLRERVLDIRMFPIGSVFSKLARQVRDVARKSGKDVRLETTGEDTLLDKTIIDEIFAPLTHIVRNAVDHGLEGAEERQTVGKPRQGTIWLSAHHLGDNVVIELKDDGRGLNSEKIGIKAVEMGLMKPDAPVTEEVIQAVIFRPGVSTAEKVTDISGRGVGLDVVKKTIDKLRGKIGVRSLPNEGTTFSLKLPLTTSIIEGLVVRVGTRRFIMPILSVYQTIRPHSEDLKSVHDRPGVFFMLHGELVPILRLYDFYGVEPDETDPSKSLVVVIKDERGLHGIQVDELLHRQQVVIKNLGDDFTHVDGVTGGTILGDGFVGLILDPEEIIRIASHGSTDNEDQHPHVEIKPEDSCRATLNPSFEVNSEKVTSPDEFSNSTKTLVLEK